MSKILVKVALQSAPGGGKTLAIDVLTRVLSSYGLTVSNAVDDERQTSFWIEGDSAQLVAQALKDGREPLPLPALPWKNVAVKSTWLHKQHVCAPDCAGCQFCNGGLSYCTVCHGGEGDLPTECPGRPMVDDEMIAISNGTTDFIGGVWVAKDEGKP